MDYIVAARRYVYSLLQGRLTKLADANRPPKLCKARLHCSGGAMVQAMATDRLVFPPAYAFA